MGEIIGALVLWGVIEILGELVIGVIFEAIFEAVFEAIARILKSPNSLNRYLVGLCVIIWGAAAGWLSLLVFPALFVTTLKLRVLNLAITPLLAGLAIGIGFQRRHPGAITRHVFVFAYLFALAMALVRLALGH
jgi:hypothetical protein